MIGHTVFQEENERRKKMDKKSKKLIHKTRRIKFGSQLLPADEDKIKSLIGLLVDRKVIHKLKSAGMGKGFCKC